MSQAVMSRSAFVGGAAALLFSCAGCGLTLTNAAAQAADAQAAVACARAHWGEAWEKLVSDCFWQDAEVAADVVSDIELLADAQGAAKQGAYVAVPPVASKLAAKRLGKP